jgi:hypothetical protein
VSLRARFLLRLDAPRAAKSFARKRWALLSQFGKAHKSNTETAVNQEVESLDALPLCAAPSHFVCIMFAVLDAQLLCAAPSHWV